MELSSSVRDGFKLSDAQEEEEIETLLDQDNPDLPRPVGTDIVHFLITSKVLRNI